MIPMKSGFSLLAILCHLSFAARSNSACAGSCITGASSCGSAFNLSVFVIFFGIMKFTHMGQHGGLLDFSHTFIHWSIQTL
jgi:hypothetical protein